MRGVSPGRAARTRPEPAESFGQRRTSSWAFTPLTPHPKGLGHYGPTFKNPSFGLGDEL